MSSPQSQILLTFYSLICTSSYKPRRIHAPKDGVSSSARSRTTLHRGFCGAQPAEAFSFRTPRGTGPGAQLTSLALGPCAPSDRFNVPLTLIWESRVCSLSSSWTPPISYYATAKAERWQFVHRSTHSCVRAVAICYLELTARSSHLVACRSPWLELPAYFLSPKFGPPPLGVDPGV